jgi:hypothetical protein
MGITPKLMYNFISTNKVPHVYGEYLYAAIYTMKMSRNEHIGGRPTQPWIGYSDCAPSPTRLNLSPALENTLISYHMCSINFDSFPKTEMIVTWIHGPTSALQTNTDLSNQHPRDHPRRPNSTHKKMDGQGSTGEVVRPCIG